jgi:hypothetical protein
MGEPPAEQHFVGGMHVVGRRIANPPQVHNLPHTALPQYGLRFADGPARGNFPRGHRVFRLVQAESAATRQG